MANVGQEVATGIGNAVTFVEKEVVKLADLATKVSVILKREKQLEPNFIAGVAALAGDVTTVASLVEVAATADGLNIAADSAAFVGLQKLIADAKALVPLVDQGIANLK
jgi:hypothetical protein